MLHTRRPHGAKLYEKSWYSNSGTNFALNGKQRLKAHNMEPEEPASAGFSLQEYLAILRRRRLIILVAFTVITVLGVFQALAARNVYQATAKLLVEGPSYNLNTIDGSNPLSSLFQISQQQTVDTQVEVLQAAPLMDQVEKQVGPTSLTVAAVGDTNVITASAESNDPKTAAAAPNTLLNLYITQDTDNQLREMETARKFVVTQGAAAHKKLVDTEKALESFKQNNHLAELTTNRDNQIARVNALTDSQRTAQESLVSLRSQIASAQTELSRLPGASVQTTEATNPTLAALAESIRTLEVQRVGLVQPGGLTSQAPQVRALDAQIAELRRRMDAQPALVASQSIGPSTFRETLQQKIADLQAQVPVQQTAVALTAQALQAASSNVGKYAALELALDRLTRQHDAAAAADKNFSDQLADLDLREKAHHAAARIIETAQVPDAPVRPKRLQSVIFAGLIGLFVGLCLALLQEFLDDRINSVADADRVLQLPSLGHVPALSAADAHLLPQMKGIDPASESYRVLRTNIHFATVDAPARTLLVTSTNPGEGKTTTAANLAFAMAMDGKNVILVDTDLRRPSLHTLLDIPPLPGLTDILLDRAAVAPQEIMSGLSVLTAGTTPPNPSELLNSRKFRNLVLELSERADVVIFDSPPVLVAADAAILASQMDGTILVLETGVTKKANARRALQLLRQARAVMLGAAYNKMRGADGPGYYYNYQYGAPAIPASSTAAQVGSAALPDAKRLEAKRSDAENE